MSPILDMTTREMAVLAWKIATFQHVAAGIEERADSGGDAGDV